MTIKRTSFLELNLLQDPKRHNKDRPFTAFTTKTCNVFKNTNMKENLPQPCISYHFTCGERKHKAMTPNKVMFWVCFLAERVQKGGWACKCSEQAHSLSHRSHLGFPPSPKGKPDSWFRSFEKPHQEFKKEEETVWERVCVCLHVLACFQLADGTVHALFFVPNLQHNHKNKNLSNALMTYLILLFPTYPGTQLASEMCHCVVTSKRERNGPPSNLQRHSVHCGKGQRSWCKFTNDKKTLRFHTYSSQKWKKNTFQFKKN